MKFRFILQEDIQAVRKMYPTLSDADFEYIVKKFDPTYQASSDSVGKYGKWMLNLAKKGIIEVDGSIDQIQEINNLLSEFERKKSSLENKDIGQFKSIDELKGKLSQTQEPQLTARQKERQMRKAYKNAELIWEDDKWQVWYPQNWDAACTLGKGTSWCTADSRTAKFYVYYTTGGGDSDYFFKLADLGDQINNKDGIKWLCQDLEMDEELKQELLSLDYKEALNRIISIYSEEYSKDCVVEWIDDWAGMHDPHEITTYDNAMAPLFVFINKQYPNHKWQLWCGDMDGDDWWNVENWHFADINDNMRNFEDEAWHDRSFADFALDILQVTPQDMFVTPPPWDDEYEED